MAPILTNAESSIASLIAGMTIAGGYNFNWGSVNEDDEALQSFPSAQIFCTGETNLDPISGTHSQAYENEATFDIIVIGKMSTVNTNPNFSINAEHNKAIDDLKKLFGINRDASGKINTILYRGFTRQIDYNGDIFRPGRLITRWLVKYTQDRIAPETNAN